MAPLEAWVSRVSLTQGLMIWLVSGRCPGRAGAPSGAALRPPLAAYAGHGDGRAGKARHVFLFYTLLGLARSPLIGVLTALALPEVGLRWLLWVDGHGLGGRSSCI